VVLIILRVRTDHVCLVFCCTITSNVLCWQCCILYDMSEVYIVTVFTGVVFSETDLLYSFEIYFCCYIRQNRKYYKYCCGTATCDLTLWIPNQLATSLITAQCTLVQGAVLRSHVVRLSACPSVCDVGGFQGRSDGVYIGINLYPPKSAQVNFLWGKK